MSDSAYFAGDFQYNICEELANFRLITGMLRDIMAQHFSDPARIGQPNLRDAIWKNAQDTGILVETHYRWVPTNSEGRPAIIIKRNGCKNLRLSVGNVRQAPSQDEYGHEHFITAWTGSHTLFCLAREGAQAELLASEVQKQLTGFGPIIQKYVPSLLRFEVVDIGPADKIEEAKESFGVPVTVGYAYEERWVLRQEAPPLTQINITLSTILGC